jgi:uncharacterized coiled-coil DUF342 family protein
MDPYQKIAELQSQLAECHNLLRCATKKINELKAEVNTHQEWHKQYQESQSQVEQMPVQYTGRRIQRKKSVPLLHQPVVLDLEKFMKQ